MAGHSEAGWRATCSQPTTMTHSIVPFHDTRTQMRPIHHLISKHEHGDVPNACINPYYQWCIQQDVLVHALPHRIQVSHTPCKCKSTRHARQSRAALPTCS